MGTRGLVGFYADGHLKVAYNHFDSYPEGVGVNVLEFARQLVSEGAEAVADTKARVAALTVIEDEESEPTDEQILALKTWKNESVGGPTGTGKPSWYQLLRETQGKPAAILAAGYLIDAQEFGHDSLFCEWGYVIDFDDEAIEVYEGFQTSPATRGKWTDGQKGEAEYKSIDRICLFKFAELPEGEEFVRAVYAASPREYGAEEG